MGLDKSAAANNYINVEEGLSRVRGNKLLYKRMLAMFLDAKEIPALEEQLKSRDTQEAAKSAHAVKGIAGNLSLPLLFDICSELCAELREGEENAKTANDYFSALEKTRAAVNEAIAGL